MSSEVASPMSPLGANVRKGKAATVFPSHVRRSFKHHPTDYTGELVRLLDDLSLVTHGISAHVAEADEQIRYGKVGNQKITSDFVTREVYHSLANDGYACLILSKGTQAPLTFPEYVPHGGYVVCLSPLSYDSLNDHFLSAAGTVFSVYKRKSSASLPGRSMDLQQNLGDQVAAGYCVYSSATTLYYTLGQGLYSFVLHPLARQYFLQPNHKLMWEPNVTCVYLDRNLLREDTPLAHAVKKFVQDHNLRVGDSGCAVVNVALCIQNGGLLVWKDAHLLCEAAPISFLVEQGMGVAVSDQGQRVLDLKSVEGNYHAPLTICCGPASAVEEICATMQSLQK
ncbi:Fructose-1,6-bisphosphatase class 1 [Porphyridium purpureum]|uniref:Fructose-1,6-bisphosphatase class 1 n=1 Tax=Porphyridium purpureum TaxID=35688 RepID=A0A5J4ZAI3_PORPP|nr:Fructose-1,6-bisphosphatase class 1 [Porphyridium purpureum]|eukprot:POR3931..scf295_1